MASRRAAVALCCALSGGLALGAATRPAAADRNDLVLSRLADFAGDDVIGSNQDFRTLASELGVVLAPRLLAPADTLGFGGFEFTADVAVTSVSEDGDHWRALEDGARGSLTTLGFFVRKGIWLPLPSFEIGVGAVNLGDSKLWASQGYVKFALHEGYHELPLPSFAVRGGASRIMGQSELDLTIASLDVSASKDFGLGGAVTVTPYLGWNWLFIVPRSEVVDKTPHIDLRDDPMDAQNNFVFADQDDIVRNRFFVGGKLRHYVFTVHLEAAIALPGGSTDDRAGTDLDCRDATMPVVACDATDQSGAQSTLTLGVGLDF